jgi:hypothetical protein
MALSHAEQEQRARAYEAARQQYITKCMRDERAQRKRLERRQNFRTDLKVAITFVFFIFAAVWFFLNVDTIVGWWNANLHGLWIRVFGE